MRHNTNVLYRGALSALVASALASGCSLQTMAVNAVMPTIANPEVYLSEEDPELIRNALPFLLKTIESVLETEPSRRDALLPHTGRCPVLRAARATRRIPAGSGSRVERRSSRAWESSLSLSDGRWRRADISSDNAAQPLRVSTTVRNWLDEIKSASFICCAQFNCAP